MVSLGAGPRSSGAVAAGAVTAALVTAVIRSPWHARQAPCRASSRQHRP